MQCQNPEAVTGFSGTCPVIDTTLGCSSQVQVFVHVMNAAGVLFQCLLSDDEMLTYSVPISDLVPDTWVDLVYKCERDIISVRLVIDWINTTNETGYKNFMTERCFTDPSACHAVHCEADNQVPCNLISLSGTGYSEVDGIYTLLPVSDWVSGKPKYEKSNTHFLQSRGSFGWQSSDKQWIYKTQFDTNIGQMITDVGAYSWADSNSYAAIPTATWGCVPDEI